MLPERLKQIYKSPKSTLLGILALVAGLILYAVQVGDGGLESLDPSTTATEAMLLLGMVIGFFKKDK